MLDDPHEKSSSEKRIQEDRDDLGRETSGAVSGRIKRFNPSSDDKLAALDEKRSKDAMLMALLDELASPEQVAALMAAVADLQDRLDQAFAELEEQTEVLEARTVTLDGQAIYLTEDGSYRTVSGEIINARDLPDDMPGSPATWAEYVALLERRAELSCIQTDVIDVIHERAAEGDMTAREVRDFEGYVERELLVLDGQKGPVHEAAPSVPKVADFGPANVAPAY